jgi:hypothetical protein
VVGWAAHIAMQMGGPLLPACPGVLTHAAAADADSGSATAIGQIQLGEKRGDVCLACRQQPSTVGTEAQQHPSGGAATPSLVATSLASRAASTASASLDGTAPTATALPKPLPPVSTPLGRSDPGVHGYLPAACAACGKSASTVAETGLPRLGLSPVVTASSEGAAQWGRRRPPPRPQAP